MFMVIIIPSGKISVYASDDYTYKNGKVGAADAWGFLQRECTSFCAWRIRQRHGISFTNSYGGYTWGNAGNWDDTAKKLGITVNQTPKKGCIAFCNPNTHGAGGWGHVAWVYLVSGNKVYIEEYNWDKADHTYQDRMVDKSTFSGFIHIEDRAKKTFTVKYNSNGGQGSMTNTTVEYGVGTNLRKSTFTRSGYTFAGWNLYKYSDKTWYYTNGSKTGWYAKGKQPTGYRLEIYKDQAKVKWTTDVNKDTIEVYAVWQQNDSGTTHVIFPIAIADTGYAETGTSKGTADSGTANTSDSRKTETSLAKDLRSSKGDTDLNTRLKISGQVYTITGKSTVTFTQAANKKILPYLQP